MVGENEGKWFCWLLWLFSSFYVETSLVENALEGGLCMSSRFVKPRHLSGD